MRFTIDKNIFDTFPTLIIGIIIVRNASNKGVSEQITSALRQEEFSIQAKYTSETIIQNEKIIVWRHAYSVFGAKPKEHKSSVENIYRLVLNGIELRHINKLVDIYNFISLKHMLPLGGEDIDKIEGDITLTCEEKNEKPVLLLVDKESRPPHKGEVIYKDSVSAICRRWNWREADRTKLTPETKNCILVIEGLTPITKEEVETATKELKNLVQKLCGGNVTHALMYEKNS